MLYEYCNNKNIKNVDCNLVVALQLKSSSADLILIEFQLSRNLCCFLYICEHLIKKMLLRHLFSVKLFDFLIPIAVLQSEFICE